MTTLESAGTDQDIWHVEVAPDDVRAVTLDELDEAFQKGYVNESTRVWQEGMPSAMTLGELLGGNDDAVAEPTPVSAYAPVQTYAEPQPAYAQSYAGYGEPQTAYAQHAYAEPHAAAYTPSYASSYVPPRSPPPSRVPESAWPPVVATNEASPQRSSYAPAPVSTPAPPSMAPLAFDVPDYDNPYARSGGKGKFLLAAFVVAAAAGGVVAFQMHAKADETPAPAIQAPLPAPEPPKSHAYDPGPPVKVGESKPPLELTVRDQPKADDKKLDDKKLDDKKLDPKKALASGKKPKPVAHARRAAPSGKAGVSNFKLGKSGSKYDPLNGSL